MLSRNENVLARYTVLLFAGRLMSRRATAGLRNLKRRLEGGHDDRPRRKSSAA
jgi:hypothetical protein